MTSKRSESGTTTLRQRIDDRSRVILRGSNRCRLRQRVRQTALHVLDLLKHTAQYIDQRRVEVQPRLLTDIGLRPLLRPGFLVRPRGAQRVVYIA